MIITAPMIFAAAGILIVFLSPKLFAGDFDNWKDRKKRVLPKFKR